MSKKKRSIWDYHQSAFWEKLNLLGLTAVTASAIFFNNPAFLALGAGLELLYLYFVPNTKWYRGRIDKRFAAEDALLRQEQRKKLLTGLSTPEQLRFKRLERLRHKIIEASEETKSDSMFIIESDLGKLDYLLDSYLELSSTLKRYQYHLKNADCNAIQKDIDRLENQLKTDDILVKNKNARRIVEKNLGILHKRIQKLDHIEGHLKSIRAQIETIEDTFGLVHDQILMMGSSEEISQDLDVLISNVELTEQTLMDTSEYFDDLQRMERELQ